MSKNKVGKNIIKCTVAATVLAGSLSGIPLSTNGVSQLFGVPVVRAASSSTQSDLLGKIKQLHEALDAAGKENLEAALKAVQAVPDDSKHDLIRPVIGKFNLTEDQKHVLGDLANEILYLNYDPEGAFLEKLRSNEAYRKVLVELSFAAGLDTSVSVDAVMEYFLHIQDLAQIKLLALSAVELSALTKDESKQEAFLESLLADVRKEENSPVNKLLNHYGINSEDLKAVKNNIRDAIGQPVYSAAVNSLVKAYFKILDLDAANPGVPVDPVDPVDPVNPVDPPVNPTYPTVIVTPPASDLDSTFNQLLQKLANASDSEKQELVKQAVQLANEELKKVQTLDASKLAVVAGNEALVELGPELNDLLDKAKAILDKLADFLNKAGSKESLPSVAFKIDLGNVAQETVTLKIPEASMQKWGAIPFGSLDVTVNGLTASFPRADEFQKSFAFTIKQQDASQQASLKAYKAVSPVYDFSLTLGGVATESFDHPISLWIPVAASAGVDKELLSAARIENGSLKFQGGELNGDYLVEPRNHFSSYVVVENKVAFNDVLSVKAWAGRQIEVLAAKGAIEGRGNGSFDPKGTVTRAEFAKMLIHAFNLEGKSEAGSFSDVPSQSWFAPYVGYAVNKGIINGRTASLFAPNAPITRAEMATMVSRTLKASNKIGKEAAAGTDTNLAAFKDGASINASLREGAALAASLNIVIGDNGYFKPNANASRAEAAVMIYRALQVK